MALLPVAVFAASPSVGKITAGGSQAEWQISADNERVTLTVVGPDGFTYEKSFPAGKNPSLRLQDGPNRTLPDGSYTYELRVTPKISAEVKKQLTDARAKGDDAAVASIQRANGLTRTTLQSGGFQVSGGTFVSSDQTEVTAHDNATTVKKGTAGVSSNVTKGKITTDDNVIADDLIVQGSACVGLDCVNGESFGFDTIRLKENNTRIKFEDTSSSAGFPTDDWQLTANDSGSGTLNKFSIEDITTATVPFTVEGSTPTNALYVDSTGFIGLGTAAPLLMLHESKGDTPAIRLEQTSASGFTAQTWDIGANEANFFVRDLTGGSRLPFRIRPGAPTSSIDINASGQVGVGTASPGANFGKLQVFATSPSMLASFGTDQVAMTMFHNGARVAYFYNGYNDGTDRVFFGNNRVASVEFNASSGLYSIRTTAAAGATGTAATFTDRFVIDVNGNIGIGTATPTSPITHSNGATLSSGGTWTNASSRALKQDIRELSLDAAKSALQGLDPVEYEYKADPNEHHVGFIAEDVPAIVATQDRKGLSPMDIVAVLTKVVQDQQQTIDTLSQRIAEIEKNKQ